MRSGALLVHVGGANRPVLVAYLEDLVYFLLRAYVAFGHSSHMDSELLVLVNLQVTLARVQQVLDFLIVDLDEADLDAELGVLRLCRDLLEETRDHARDDSACLLVFNVFTGHGVGFSRASLPVGEDRAVVAIEDAVDDGTHSFVVDLLLRAVHVVNLVVVVWYRLMLPRFGVDAHEGDCFGVGELAADFVAGSGEFTRVEGPESTVDLDIAIGAFFESKRLPLKSQTRIRSLIRILQRALLLFRWSCFFNLFPLTFISRKYHIYLCGFIIRSSRLKILCKALLLHLTSLYRQVRFRLCPCLIVASSSPGSRSNFQRLPRGLYTLLL